MYIDQPVIDGDIVEERVGGSDGEETPFGRGGRGLFNDKSVWFRLGVPDCRDRASDLTLGCVSWCWLVSVHAAKFVR